MSLANFQDPFHGHGGCWAYIEDLVRSELLIICFKIFGSPVIELDGAANAASQQVVDDAARYAPMFA